MSDCPVRHIMVDTCLGTKMKPIAPIFMLSAQMPVYRNRIVVSSEQKMFFP